MPNPVSVFYPARIDPPMLDELAGGKQPVERWETLNARLVVRDFQPVQRPDIELGVFPALFGGEQPIERWETDNARLDVRSLAPFQRPDTELVLISSLFGVPPVAPNIDTWLSYPARLLPKLPAQIRSEVQLVILAVLFGGEQPVERWETLNARLVVRDFAPVQRPEIEVVIDEALFAVVTARLLALLGVGL